MPVSSHAQVHERYFPPQLRKGEFIHLPALGLTHFTATEVGQVLSPDESARVDKHTFRKRGKRDSSFRLPVSSVLLLLLHPASHPAPRLQKKRRKRTQSPKARNLEPSSRGSFVRVQSTKIRRDRVKKKLRFYPQCSGRVSLVWVFSSWNLLSLWSFLDCGGKSPRE